MIPWWHTEFGIEEREALLTAYDQRRITLGEECHSLERELAELFETKDAVATSSGTAGICMSLIAAGIGPGDEVILPNLGWIATAQAAHIIGANVKLVDTRPDSPSTSAALVADAVSSQTKAIIPMNFHGRDCGATEILRYANEQGIPVIEDACKAMFCKRDNRYVGSNGFSGCFSMGIVSLVSCGYGGFILTNESSRANRLRSIRDQGCQRMPRERYASTGFNFRVSDLLLALARAQLSRRL